MADGHIAGQPYEYRRRELVEPDWTRFPGWRDVTPSGDAARILSLRRDEAGGWRIIDLDEVASGPGSVADDAGREGRRDLAGLGAVPVGLPGVARVGGEPALILDYSYAVSGHASLAEVAVFRHGGHTFVATLLSFPERWDVDRSALDGLLGSWYWTAS